MRELEFRYFFKEQSNWRIQEFTLDRLEGGVIHLSNLSKYVARAQYTGLKDVEQVKIFEFDLLQCEQGLKWIVKFINGSFVACNPKDDLDFVMLDDYNFAVVGNKSQNSELLEE